MLDRVLNTPLNLSSLSSFCTATLVLTNFYNSRSSYRRCSIKEAVFEKFPIFTGKHLCWNLFLIKLQPSGLQLYSKEAPTQVFFCEYCEIFKNSYFEEHLRMAASVTQAFITRVVAYQLQLTSNILVSI